MAAKQENHKLKSKHKISVHSVGDDIPIDTTAIPTGPKGELKIDDHVIVWRLFESPNGELEATDMFADAFNDPGFPKDFTPERPGHYQVFMVHYDANTEVLHVYSQGPHGVIP